MAITETFRDGSTTVTHTGAVLRITSYTEHVPSDNAMIDDGVRINAEVWYEGRVQSVYLYGGREGRSRHGVEDADAFIRILADEYHAFVAWVRSLAVVLDRQAALERDARQIRPGVRVRVVAGRKVKKGTEWFVHKMGDGQYGLYTHLSSQPNGRGDYVQYVNPENLDRIDGEVPDLAFPATPYGYDAGETVCRLALDANRHLQPTGWLAYARQSHEALGVLRDAWLDSGHPVPAALDRLVEGYAATVERLTNEEAAREEERARQRVQSDAYYNDLARREARDEALAMI